MEKLRDQESFRTNGILWLGHVIIDCFLTELSIIWSTFALKLFALSLILFILGCDTRYAIDHSAVSCDISPSGTQIVFSSASGDLFLFDIPTQNIEQVTKTQDVESSPVFLPNGMSIIYSTATGNENTSHIFRCRIGDRKTEQLTSEENVFDAYPSISSDGSKVIFSRAHRFRTYSTGGMTWDDWDIYIMDADGSNVARLTNQKYRSIARPQFSLDGQTAYFSSRIIRQDTSRYSAIFEVSTTGEQLPKNLTPDDDGKVGSAALGSEPSLSYDGKKMAFISDRNKRYQYDLFVMNCDGSNPTSLNLSNVSKYLALPFFSPDGKSIFFLAETAKNANSQPLYSLWMADVTGKNPALIAGKDLFSEPVPHEKSISGGEQPNNPDNQ